MNHRYEHTAAVALHTFPQTLGTPGISTFPAPRTGCRATQDTLILPPSARIPSFSNTIRTRYPPSPSSRARDLDEKSHPPAPQTSCAPQRTLDTPRRIPTRNPQPMRTPPRSFRNSRCGFWIYGLIETLHRAITLPTKRTSLSQPDRSTDQHVHLQNEAQRSAFKTVTKTCDHKSMVRRLLGSDDILYRSLYRFLCSILFSCHKKQSHAVMYLMNNTHIQTDQDIHDVPSPPRPLLLPLPKPEQKTRTHIITIRQVRAFNPTKGAPKRMSNSTTPHLSTTRLERNTDPHIQRE